MCSKLKTTFGVAVALALGVILAGTPAVLRGQGAGKAAAGEEPGLTPLKLNAAPTITCIGVRWDVRGDSNANATGTMEFREAGKGEWASAFALRRTPGRANAPTKNPGGVGKYTLERHKQNYLAGSIFGLKPGTKYDVRVTLNDPDGGGTSQTIAVATRPVPAVPKGGHVVEVRGGGQALKKAAEAARPGDVLVVHAGKYEGGIVISAKGTAEKPICITAAGDGEVLLHGGDAKKNKLKGIEVGGTFVRIEGLSFYNFQECVYGNRTSNNLAVMRCKMNHFHTAILSKGTEGYFADNSIRESYNPLDLTIAPGERNEGHGVELGHEAGGTVVCYNEISLVADGIRFWSHDSDAYGNDVIFNVDDGIELDGGGPNMRIFDNRMSFTGENGVSFQPYIGGPAYLIRNFVIGPKESSIKNRYEADGGVFINNTLVSYDGQANDLPFGSFTRNNLFLTTPGKGRRSIKVDASANRVGLLDMDHDGFGPIGPNGIPLPEFSAQTGLEKHGVQFASNDQALAHPPGEYPLYKAKQWTVPEAFLTEKTRPHPDLSLKPGSAAIGAGVSIPNITAGADGKAPDLGALQLGQPLPHYGPRTAP